MVWDMKSREDFLKKIFGNDTGSVYKTLISRISVINIDSGKRW